MAPTAEDVERERAHRDTNHALVMVEELDRLGVERKVIQMLARLTRVMQDNDAG